MRTRWVPLVSLALGMMWSLCPAFGQWTEHKGYRINPEEAIQVQVRHLRNWSLQNNFVAELSAPVEGSGLFEFDTGVKPRFFSHKRNAVETATSMRYADIVRAGGDTVSGGAEALSNDSWASNAIDGDVSTYWQPAEEDWSIDGLLNWELIVDLGQLVVVDSVTVIFPSGQLGEDDMGDPPKTFGVLGSLGDRSLAASATATALKFRSLGKATASDLAPVGDDGKLHQITIPVMPLLEETDFDGDGRPDMSGSFVHYVKIKITDSDLDAKTFLGAGDEGREAWEALRPERRGRKVFRRIAAGGFTTQVDSTFYYNEERLPPDRRAPIQYYMRELPRVVEIKVWTQGDNVVRHPRARAGATYEAGGRGNPIEATDGLFMTYWTANCWSPLYDKGLVWYDLGATFWVDKLYCVINDYDNDHFLGHRFEVSDGTLLNPVSMSTEKDFVQLQNALQWDDVIQEGKVDNRDTQVQMFVQEFDQRPIRFLQVRNIDVSGEQSGGYGVTGNLAEFQLYGEGYPVTVQMESGPIRIQRGGEDVRAAMTRISWDAEAVVQRQDPETGEVGEVTEPLSRHPAVKMNLQTRTSDVADTMFTYYAVVRRGGREIKRTKLTKAEYDDLVANPNPRTGEPEKQGVLRFTGWSGWSRPYRPTGTTQEAVITSPNPRRFLQFRATITSQDPLKTARLRSITVDLERPLSLGTAAELALLSDQGEARGVSDLAVDTLDYRQPVGVDGLLPHAYAYFLRAAGPDLQQFRTFDEIRIDTGRPTELRGVRVGEVRVEELADPVDSAATITRVLEGSTRFTDYFEWVAEDSVFRNSEGQELQVLSESGANSLRLRLPYPVNADARGTRHALVEIQFDVHVFRQGAVFPGFVRDSSTPDSPFQRVEVSKVDATDLVGWDNASLRLEYVDALINKVSVSPYVTPNNDGVNDRLDLSFVLVQVTEESPVHVHIYNLAGQKVGEAAQQAAGSAVAETARMGLVQFTWDARDSAGNLVPPGLYVAVIEVRSDEEESRARTFGVVY